MQSRSSQRYATVTLDLMRQSSQAGVLTRLMVSGTSMLPLLRPGDTVWLLAVDPTTLRPGDLVLVRQHDRLLTHRLIAVAAGRAQTKGDNNRLADLPTPAQHIHGRIVALERGGTRIDLRRRGWSLAKPLLSRLSRWEQHWYQRAAYLPALIAGIILRLLIRALLVIAPYEAG